MKRILLTAGTLLLLVFLLLHPQEGLAAARTGMTLWLNSLIPALLPFIILTGVLIHTGSIEKILLPFRPLFEFLLGVSVYGGYVFLLGMLCGYPMGAKLASDMYESHKISRREAEYLITFCNNASPSFIITYLGQICLLNKVPASRLFLCLFLSDFICMMIFRLLIYRNHLPGSVPHTDRHDEFSCFPYLQAASACTGHSLLYPGMFCWDSRKSLQDCLSSLTPAFPSDSAVSFLQLL